MIDYARCWIGFNQSATHQMQAENARQAARTDGYRIPVCKLTIVTFAPTEDDAFNVNR
jgi:hypothetical protein